MIYPQVGQRYSLKVVSAAKSCAILLKMQIEANFFGYLSKIIKPGLLLFLLLMVFIGWLSAPPAAGQIGQEVSVVGEQAIGPGDIIIRSRLTGRFGLATVPGTSELFGVIAAEPAIAFRQQEGEGVTVVQTGQTLVNVSLLGGPIMAGDYVTSSGIPGHGQRAGPNHHYIVGVAIESFNETDVVRQAARPDQTGAVGAGQVLVDLEIRPQEIEPVAPPPRAAEPPMVMAAPGQIEHYSAMIVRYIMAVLVALGSIYLSFRFFQLNVSGGLPALGRNPLAQKPIRQMLLLHVFVTVLISAAGLGLSVFILILPLIFL